MKITNISTFIEIVKHRNRKRTAGAQSGLALAQWREKVGLA
jgi:hypothetical protein